MSQILMIYLVLKVAQHLGETWLAALNRSYYTDESRQAEVCKTLAISPDDFSKTLAYTNDKYNFSRISSWFNLVIMILFLALGGFGWVEQQAIGVSSYWAGGTISTGLVFFGIFGLLTMIVGMPFEWYQTFTIEERHGFNRQSKKGFFVDRLKGIFLGVVLGSLLLSGLLYVMEATGDSWWLWAWAVMSGFSIVAAWIYPTLLAPLFNKFTPIESGDLKDGIFSLAKKIGFRAAGIYVMDASKRSSHGNAYFTGMFGEKRIVLFDNLVESLKSIEVVAVLAHELGHFKLNHVRWGILRGILMTGVMFFLMSLCLSLEGFYSAFALKGISNYGGLLVFSMWFGLLDFVLNPIGSFISRRNEFAADAFASNQLGTGKDLVSALIKLRESNHAMPLSHPVFSAFYHSHPPLDERLRALNA